MYMYNIYIDIYLRAVGGGEGIGRLGNS